MKEHTALFVIGERNSGKSSVIRALTGCGRGRKWKVVTSAGNRILALVIISALQESERTKNTPPKDILKSLHEVYDVTPDSYQLLICAVELSEGHTSEEYLQVFIKEKFDVRVAIIEKGAWDGGWNGFPDQANLSKLKEFLSTNNLKTLTLDFTNSDEHNEARKIRDKLYP